MLIIDGMTDEEYSFAQMPNLKRLIDENAYGMLETTPKGMYPDTTTCTMTLLGLDEDSVKKVGRGWLEALGAGLDFGEFDLICKASWVCLDDDGRLTGTWDEPVLPGIPEYTHLGGYRGMLVLPGQAAFMESVRTFPPHQSMGMHIDEVMPSGCPELERIAQQCRGERTALIPWGPGIPGEMQQQRGAVITAADPLKGVAWAMGLDLIQSDDFTGDVDTNLATKLEAALYAADNYPFVLLHVNGADEASHRLDRKAKYDFLARVDAELLPGLEASGHRFLVCSDHGSCPETGRHIGNPQPFALVGSISDGDMGMVPGRSALLFLL